MRFFHFCLLCKTFFGNKCKQLGFKPPSFFTRKFEKCESLNLSSLIHCEVAVLTIKICQESRNLLFNTWNQEPYDLLCCIEDLSAFPLAYEASLMLGAVHNRTMRNFSAAWTMWCESSFFLCGARQSYPCSNLGLEPSSYLGKVTPFPWTAGQLSNQSHIQATVVNGE